MKASGWMFIILGVSMVAVIVLGSDLYHQPSLPLEETRWWNNPVPDAVRDLAVATAYILPALVMFLGVANVWCATAPRVSSSPKQCDCCGED